MEGGACELILGPMGSGKTTELCRRIDRARRGGLPCVAVKWGRDTRYSDGPEIKTHAKQSMASSDGCEDLASLRVVTALELLTLELKPDELDVGVDEGQFYPDLRAAVDRWMREGRRVYIAALDGDYRRRPFGQIPEVLPLATDVQKLRAVCVMRRHSPPADAVYTVRTVTSDSLELIGSSESYKAACPACYHALDSPVGPHQ